MNKKVFMFLFLSILAIFVVSGCGTNKESAKKENEEKETSIAKVEKEENTSENHEHEPMEVPGDAKCAFCNMVVYGKDHEMGAFSAQAVDKNGNRHYFDDSGCLLNQERMTGEKFAAAWVRDVNTKEWVNLEDAKVVQGDIQTPMKYGYGFFANEADAETFINANADKGIVKSDLESLDEMAEQRFKMKMEKMKKQDMDNGHMNDTNNHGQNMHK